MIMKQHCITESATSYWREENVLIKATKMCMAGYVSHTILLCACQYDDHYLAEVDYSIDECLSGHCIGAFLDEAIEAALRGSGSFGLS